ncbi:ERF family protein [Enterococcus faecium]|uniref:ERF family protein n=4 Tax=Enterococcus faecium TaxID=1352 RepID=UPI00295E64D5|nr:ERF family protein [Enterococcus faecium]WOV55828.1 ERF family protein [Enterococcus faecium]
MTESENLSFNEKIISIQNDLKAPKSQYSKYGNYNYRSCEDILKAVKPLNKKMGLLLTLTDEPVMIGDRFYIKATALLTDGNESKSIVGYAREAESKTKMDDSQVTGSASSYARKYALNGLYLIDDKKDSDALPPTDQASEENLHEVFIETFNKYVQEPVVLVNFNILKNISKFLQNVVVLDLIEHCKPVICFQIYSLAL